MITRALHEAQLEEERVGFRAGISEREGAMVKLQHEFDCMLQELNSVKVEYVTLSCYIHSIPILFSASALSR